MAHEVPLLERTRVATASFSSSQFCAAVLDSNGQLALPGAGVDIYGIVQNKPAAGKTAAVRCFGVSKMVVGASTVAAGDKIMVDTAGKAVTATTGNFVIGQAEDGGATGTLISVLVRPGGKI